MRAGCLVNLIFLYTIILIAIAEQYKSIIQLQWPCCLGRVLYSTTRILGSWVRILFETRLYVRAFFVSVYPEQADALRWADQQPRSPTKCLNIQFRHLILNWNRTSGAICESLRKRSTNYEAPRYAFILFPLLWIQIHSLAITFKRQDSIV
jgi:hypothetical protein